MRHTHYGTIDQFDFVNPGEVAQFMDDLDGTILATHGPWTIVGAYIYQKYVQNGYFDTKKETFERVQKLLPVSTRVSLQNTIESFEAGVEMNDFSDVGKGKKNRFQKNLIFINTLEDQSPSAEVGQQESLEEFA